MPNTKRTVKGLFLTKTAPDPLPKTTELATFAAGCFWGVEDEFRRTPGVVGTAVGYTGGKVVNPTYQQVCAGTTGHAEAVLIEYDPTIVNFEKLLDLFWEIHDPTTPNRQGPDVGEQYRSAIFFQDIGQKKIASASREKLGASGQFKNPIVTELTLVAPFFLAEDYHQHYVEKGGIAACHRR